MIYSRSCLLSPVRGVVPTGQIMVGVDRLKRRIFYPTLLRCPFTARGKRTGRGGIVEHRGHAFDRVQPWPFFFIDLRQAAQQPKRVWMAGVGVKLFYIGVLDNKPTVHH